MVVLNTLTPGTHFVYGNVEWIALEHLGSGTLCLSADITECRAFDTDNHNNFKTSTLRAYLNEEYIDSLVAAGADRRVFLPHWLDLTAEDGIKDYDVDEARIGLLTYDQYRKYRELLPIIPHWWWTCTPNSVTYACGIRCIRSDGWMGINLTHYDYCGVRPLCRLIFGTVVSEVQ